MSALDDLKDRIDSAIYTNTEQNITGDGLQTVLDDMVDTMGVSVSQNTSTKGNILKIGNTFQGIINGEFNVNDYNDKTTNYDNFTLVLAAVPDKYKSLGIKLVYKLADLWYTTQFYGSSVSNADWYNSNNWKILSPLSVAQNSNTKNIELQYGQNSYKVVNEQLIQNHISIVGDGSNYVYVEKIGTIRNRIYEIVFDDNNWARDNTGTDTSQWIFGVVAYKGGTEYRLKYFYRTQTVPKSIQVEIPDCDYLRIGCRANTGVVVNLSISDITDYYGSIKKIDNQMYISWANGTYSTNPIVLTNNSNRLRPYQFLVVRKGMRAFINVVSGQWVANNQFYLDKSGWYVRDEVHYENFELVFEHDCLFLPVIGKIDTTDIAPSDTHSEVVIVDEIETNDIMSLLKVQSFNNLTKAQAAQKNYTYPATALSNYKQFMTIVHVTDLHGDMERAERAFKVADLLGAVIVCSGDMVFYYNTDDYSYIRQIQNKYPNVVVLPCIGNHEAWPNQLYTQNDYTSLSVLYEKIIAPTKGDTPWVYPTGVDNPTYFYYDDSTYKIRFISLNKYEEVNRQEYLSQEQVDFFISALENIPEDYSVIVIQHSPEGGVKIIPDKTMFMQIDGGYTSGYDGAGIAKLIIDAFISKTTLNTTYTFPKGDVNIVADFTDVNSNDFIGFICGHTHCDGIGYVDYVTNKQLVLECTCSNAFINRNKDGSFGIDNPGLTEWSDLPRQDNAANQDAFNVYVIDKENGEVRVVRIGSDVTYNFSKRDCMIVSYR